MASSASGSAGSSRAAAPSSYSGMNSGRLLNVRMETSSIKDSGSIRYGGGFDFPVFVEPTSTFNQLKQRIIGHPDGLVVHTDACKGLETAVEEVWPGVEHRECMRHLAANFGKKFKGKFYDDNLWPSSLTYSVRKHNYHLNQLKSKQKVKEYLEEFHTKVWARSRFNEICKVDYVNNNLAESFNVKIRKVKGLPVVDMVDKIRQFIMEKIALRQKIAAQKMVGHKILPNVMRELNAKTRGLRMTLFRRNDNEAEITATDKDNREWRYPVNLGNKTCSCRQWQIRGQPCIHALYFITSLSPPHNDIEQYVDEVYSVARFNKAYADNLPVMLGKRQWEQVDPGYKLHPPLLKRPPGRPRKVRIRSSAEGTGLGPRKRKCGRCGGFGHIQRGCKNTVDPTFGMDDNEIQAGDAVFEAGAGEPDLTLVASSASSTKGVKKNDKKNVKKNVKKLVSKPVTPKRKNMVEDTSCSVTGSVASPLAIVEEAVQPNSPAQNTRSKKRLHL